MGPFVFVRVLHVAGVFDRLTQRPRETSRKATQGSRQGQARRNLSRYGSCLSTLKARVMQCVAPTNPPSLSPPKEACCFALLLALLSLSTDG